MTNFFTPLHGAPLTLVDLKTTRIFEHQWFSTHHSDLYFLLETSRSNVHGRKIGPTLGRHAGKKDK